MTRDSPSGGYPPEGTAKAVATETGPNGRPQSVKSLASVTWAQPGRIHPAGAFPAAGTDSDAIAFELCLQLGVPGGWGPGRSEATTRPRPTTLAIEAERRPVARIER